MQVDEYLWSYCKYLKHKRCGKLFYINVFKMLISYLIGLAILERTLE